jgi:hypothetical protein
MKVYGNLMNRLLESSASPIEPLVGMGATVTLYSDRHACTVIAVLGEFIFLRRDKTIRIDGNNQSDSQSYRYEPDPDGEIYIFKKNKDGYWREVVFNKKTSRFRFVYFGKGLVLDDRDEYYDYDF